MSNVNEDNLEGRLIVLEQQVKALKETMEKFMLQSIANNEKLSEKLDEAIRSNLENNLGKPSFTHCTERKEECGKRFIAMEDKVFAVEQGSMSKGTTTLISTLMFIIGVLGTLLAIAYK